MKNLVSPVISKPEAVRPLSDMGSGEVVGSKSKTWLVVALIVLVGVGTGWWLANGSGKGGSLLKSGGNGPAESEAGTDNEEFKDEAEGLLEANDGSVTTEGTHVLVREGGPSQTVYLTSSVVDLTKFEGKKVKIKGETFSGQNTGWFMDVGWIKVI